jgi:ATP-binding cassette subfamily C exporter for protease/lipase
MATKSIFERSVLTRSVWAFRREFALVGAFSLLVNLLMLTPTLYMLQVYDRVLTSQSELTLLAMSLLTLALFGLMAVAEWLRSRLLVRTGVRLDDRLSTQVFKASFAAHLNQAGTDAARSFSDLILVRQFLTGNGIFAFFDAPWTPIYIMVLYFLHPWLGALGLVFALVQVALAWFGHRRTVRPGEAAAKAASVAGGFLQGKLRNAEVLEAMGMVGDLQLRWSERHRDHMAQSALAQQLTHRITAWSKFVRYSQQSLALGAGALLVIDGQLSPGAMIAANVLMSRALAPIDLLVSSWRQLDSVRAAFDRLTKLLSDYPLPVAEAGQAMPVGQVAVREVTAGAAGREAPILKGVNLVVPAGAVVAIMGPSGSGKSTLARVLMGIWPQVSGDVLLDGVPLSQWDRSELGPRLGYLPQDVELFDGTIAENIARFGKVDSAQVIAAAQRTGLHEMILRFPKGYDTPMGEAGNLLSGGQRQRIALARAVYGDPVLLVLDEPNANLDDAGEAALYKAVAQLKAAGSTVFLITHRPGALAVADRILVLRDGQVQADGPRDDVLTMLRSVRPATAPLASPVPPLPPISPMPPLPPTGILPA